MVPVQTERIFLCATCASVRAHKPPLVQALLSARPSVRPSLAQQRPTPHWGSRCHRSCHQPAGEGGGGLHAKWDPAASGSHLRGCPYPTLPNSLFITQFPFLENFLRYPDAWVRGCHSKWMEWQLLFGRSARKQNSCSLMRAPVPAPALPRKGPERMQRGEGTKGGDCGRRKVEKWDIRLL